MYNKKLSKIKIPENVISGIFIYVMLFHFKSSLTAQISILTGKQKINRPKRIQYRKQIGNGIRF